MISSHYCCHLINLLLHGEKESDQRKSREWKGASEMGTLQWSPCLVFLHHHWFLLLFHLLTFSYPPLLPSLLRPLYLSPVLLALVNQAHQNQSLGYPMGKQKDLEMRIDCPGLYPARCSGCCCYWPGSQRLNSYCLGTGHLHCHSPSIGLQLRLEVEQWKELSFRSSVLMLEGRVGLVCGRLPLLSSLTPLLRPLRMGICKVHRKGKTLRDGPKCSMFMC
ncbi:hypothetical protein XENOCAPTIV_009819 [Xenoophorus captivus]|uniref:Uncharacterized protein n=1 Tax=Xenoophorus captivus TaxID=1517983 RepID=A0ABV0RC16_9TELE